MELIGKVELILNNCLTLISSSISLNENAIISVFVTLDHPKLKEVGIEEPILFPKGELRVVCQQSKDKYLAEPFREMYSRTRKIVVPSPLAKSLGSTLSQWISETKEITEEVPGEWSAKLNESQSLKIDIPKVVSVGDLVGRQ